VPLTVETKYLIDADFLSNLKTGVVILNTSRGPVLQTAALIQSIQSGKVAYAALDVLENEKIDQLDAAQQREFDQLCKESKVLLTSHIAGWTEESYYKIASVLAKKTIQYFNNQSN
jgi:D-3-phosphoglycerate dehydrogenase